MQDFLDLATIEEVSRSKPLLPLPLPESERVNKLNRVLGMDVGCTYRYPDGSWAVVDDKHTSLAWVGSKDLC